MSPASQQDPVSRRKILVLEDDIMVRLTAADDLRKSGFTVVEASNTGEALVLLRALPEVAVVVTDIKARGSMNGLSVVSWLGREMPHIKVLLAADDGVPGPTPSSSTSHVIARIRALFAP
jgi:CheY-like chemotaxis protein